MIPTYKEDGTGSGLDRMPGWFYGAERIPAQIQGQFYIPSLKQFCTEDGTILPYTFERPTEVFTSNFWTATVYLTPYDFPTLETVVAIKGILESKMTTLSPSIALRVDYIEDPKGRDYFEFSNPKNGASERFSVGRLARSIMVNGVGSAVVELRAELQVAGIV